MGKHTDILIDLGTCLTVGYRTMLLAPEGAPVILLGVEGCVGAMMIKEAILHLENPDNPDGGQGDKPDKPDKPGKAVDQWAGPDKPDPEKPVVA